MKTLRLDGDYTWDYTWGFPEIRGTFEKEYIVYWGLHWGTLIWETTT